MLFDDKTKSIAQSYLGMLGEKTEINESHFKVGDRVECINSGMKGTVIKLDKPETGKYYTVKQDSGKEMKYAPDELKKVSMDEATDPVDSSELKKSHKDRKDKDIDNDGDVDSSDEYLHKRRQAIANAMKKEAIEIQMQKKSKMGENQDEDEDDDDYDYDEDDKEESSKKNDKMKVKKKDDEDNMKEASCGSKKMKEDIDQIDELSTGTLTRYSNAARGQARHAMTKLGSASSSAEVNKHSNTMTKRLRGNAAASKRLNKEDYTWDWDAILEAPEEELDALIEQLNDDELESFVSEFESLEEGNNWYQGSTGSKQPTMKDPLAGKHGRSDDLETLDPRAEADKAFSDAHRQSTDVVDYPGKDKPVTNAKAQAPARSGDKRNSEPMKTLSDIRRK